MRKQTFTVRCDGNGCGTIVEVATLEEAPDGWLRVYLANDGKYRPDTAFDLCSLRCVERWASGRRKLLQSSKSHRPSDGDTARRIMGLFESDPDAILSTRDVAELVEVSSETAYRYLNQLVAEGTVVQNTERRGPHPATWRVEVRT